LAQTYQQCVLVYEPVFRHKSPSPRDHFILACPRLNYRTPSIPRTPSPSNHSRFTSPADTEDPRSASSLLGRVPLPAGSFHPCLPTPKLPDTHHPTHFINAQPQLFPVLEQHRTCSFRLRSPGPNPPLSADHFIHTCQHLNYRMHNILHSFSTPTGSHFLSIVNAERAHSVYGIGGQIMK